MLRNYAIVIAMSQKCLLKSVNNDIISLPFQEPGSSVIIHLHGISFKFSFVSLISGKHAECLVANGKRIVSFHLNSNWIRIG